VSGCFCRILLFLSPDRWNQFGFLQPLSALGEPHFSLLASQVTHLFFRPEVQMWKRSTYRGPRSLSSLDLIVKLNSGCSDTTSTVTNTIKFIQSRLQIYKLGAELLRRTHTERWTCYNRIKTYRQMDMILSYIKKYRQMGILQSYKNIQTDGHVIIVKETYRPMDMLQS
jgi:hypothetical protein